MWASVGAQGGGGSARGSTPHGGCFSVFVGVYFFHGGSSIFSKWGGWREKKGGGLEGEKEQQTENA